MITVVLAAGIPRIPVSFGHRALIGESHPVIVASDSLVERFGGGYPIEIGWECGPGLPCGHALDEKSLSVANDVTSHLNLTAGVRNVVSPANASLLFATPDGFRVRRFVEHGEIVADAQDLASYAVEDDLWTGRLISSDLRAAVIVVQPASGDSAKSAQLIDTIYEILEPHQRAGFDFKLNGISARDVITGRELQASTTRIIPALVLVIAVVLFLLTRSISHIVIALVTMGTGLLWTLGVMGWLGWPEDEIHQILAPLILIIGVCDAVHLLSRATNENGDARQRLLVAARAVGPACAMTSTTTAVALGSFVTSGLESFVRLGSITAFGVFACLILTFTLLPILAVHGPRVAFPPARNVGAWDSTLIRGIDLIERKWRGLLVAGSVVLVVGCVGWVGFLRVDTDWRAAWGEDNQVTKWLQFYEEKLGASASLEVQIEVPEAQSIEEPKVLDVLDTLGARLSAVNGLGEASSVIDLLGRLNRALHEGDPAHDRPTGTRAGNAELFELIVLDDPESLLPWVSLDRRSARLSVQADLISHTENVKVMDDVRAVVARTVPADWEVLLTGVVATNERWEDEVQSTQLRSFPTAFLLVFGLVSVFLRSVRLGLAAMLPTLLPIVVVLGGMGWLDMGLDLGRAMIAAVMIGIGVDDSLHFLSAYDDERRSGASRNDSTRAALRSTGRALVSTSLALALGFLTLAASAWQTIASFGFFVSLTIVVALISTVVLLPALMFSPLGDRR